MYRSRGHIRNARFQCRCRLSRQRRNHRIGETISMPKVVIIGGGIAGMSAAHELLDRGFEVEVYEFRDVPGGKARSIPTPHTGVDGRKDLPGEHGFRFFPGFYKHVIDTMKRIPVNDPSGKYKCVADHLVIAQVLMMTRYVGDPLSVTARFPQS